MKLPAVGSSQHTFAQTPKATISRSVFDRSHGRRTTWGYGGGNANSLTPIYVDEMLPGDTFTMQVMAFIRMIPTVVPIMDNLYFDFFFFSVPNRLLWSNWYKFMGAQDNPGDSTSYLNPGVTVGVVSQGSLSDHFGLPIGFTLPVGLINAFPYRAYNLIWNEWFRDQNLQDSAVKNVGDGPDVIANYPLQVRGKRHDYFTSCLPLPQKAPAVNIPLSNALAVSWNGGLQPTEIRVSSTGIPYTGVSKGIGSGPSAGTNTYLTYADFSVTPIGVELDNSANYKVDASAAATINQLRQSFQLQKLYERDNRGGTRLTEIIRAHFGVTSPDARMQRPEFLGGGSVPVIMSPVPQTSVTSATPQGNLAAYGTAATSGIGFTYSATEHCTLIGLVAARADLTYQQGIDRMWSRSTRFDYYWPALAHIGEQAVLNQEIYYTNSGTDGEVFGYQERFAEYRYKPTKVCSQFNSNASDPLDYWHLAEKYTSLPTLGATWISSQPPIQRVVAVTETDPFLADLWFNLKCARPMPVYSVPGLVDHF